MATLRLILVGAILVGCGEAAGPPRPALAGTYALSTVNGYACPCVLAVVPPETIRLVRATVVIRADSTLTDTTVITYDRSPFGGVETEAQVRDGRWTPDEYEWRGDTLVRFEARRLPLADLTLRYARDAR